MYKLFLQYQQIDLKQWQRVGNLTKSSTLAWKRKIIRIIFELILRYYIVWYPSRSVSKNDYQNVILTVNENSHSSIRSISANVNFSELWISKVSDNSFTRTIYGQMTDDYNFTMKLETCVL